MEGEFLHVDAADARELIAVEWTWLLGRRRVTPFRLTQFGDWFLQDERTGEVLFLHTALAKVEKAAPSRMAFAEMLRDPRKRRAWLRPEDAALFREHGLRPERLECYGWSIFPSLGGPFDVENACCHGIALHQRLASRSGYVARRLPDDDRCSTIELVRLVWETVTQPLVAVEERLAALLVRSGVVTR